MALVVLLLTLLLALPAEAARRVAVLDFENQSGGRFKEEYSWIGLNVPETLAGKLSEVPGVQVIERAQWKKLVEELRLQLSDLFDEKKAAKIGGHLGAKVVILGSFAVFEKRVNFNLRFVDVETGRVLGALNRESPLDERLFKEFSALALEAVQVLNRRVIGGEVAVAPPEEKLRLPEGAKEKIETPPAKSLDAYALLGKGNEAFDGKRYDEAIRFYRAALSLDTDYAFAWLSLGWALHESEKWDEAEEAYLHALSLFLSRKRDKLNELLRVTVLDSLGSLAKTRKRYDEAERFFRESLDISKRLAFDHSSANTLYKLGLVAFLRGQHVEGEKPLRESVEVYRRLGDENGVAKGLSVLAFYAKLQGRYAEAERLSLETLVINRKLGKQDAVGDTLHSLASLADDRGRPEEADRLYRESLEINKRSGNDLGVLATLMQLAYRAKDRGSRTLAIIYATEALEFSRRFGKKGDRASEDIENLLRELGAR